MPDTARRLLPVWRGFVVTITLALALVATACGAGEADTADIAGIETNEGGITVKPPDVLDGDTVIENGTDPTQPADPAAGATTGDELPPAPDVDFVWFDDTPGDIASLGGTPTVLNFWASTCAACIAEMPEFEEVFQQAGSEIAFVGMNVADRRDAAVRLAEQTGVTYPLADDPDSTVFAAFSGFVMPTTVLLTADGRVAYSWAGVLTADQLRILINDHIAPGTFADV